MRQDDVFDLLKAQLAYGEADPDELPTDLDDLLHVRTLLIELGQALRAVRQVCDEKVGTLIEPGDKYEYGDSVVSFYRGYKWKPIPDAVAAFIETVDVSDVLDLFPASAMRKTGLEKVATRHGFDPKVAVDSVLEKIWDTAPRVQVKPKEL